MNVYESAVSDEEREARSSVVRSCPVRQPVLGKNQVYLHLPASTKSPSSSLA